MPRASSRLIGFGKMNVVKTVIICTSCRAVWPLRPQSRECVARSHSKLSRLPKARERWLPGCRIQPCFADPAGAHDRGVLETQHLGKIGGLRGPARQGYTAKSELADIENRLRKCCRRF